jgi:hypothetical protein
VIPVVSDLVVAQVAFEPDRLRREPRDPGDLVAGLDGFGGRIDAARDRPVHPIPSSQHREMPPIESARESWLDDGAATTDVPHVGTVLLPGLIGEEG